MSPFTSILIPCAILLGGIAAQADVFSNVPAAAEYEVAYELDIPLNGAFQDTTPVPYAVNNSATVAPGGFDRVGYYLELTHASGTEWVFTSMDAFTTAVGQTGLPHGVDNPVTFQRSVSNLAVSSNVAGVKTGSFDRGQLEFWFNNYSTTNETAVFAATDSAYDWGDTIIGTPGYGSFQIHNPGARQTVLAYNHWGSADAADDDVGIGNSTGTHKDHTFAANTATYTSRKLVVLVRPLRFAVNFTAVPVNHQVTPRNVASNNAVVPVSGSETLGGFEKAVLRVLRNGVLLGAEMEQTLDYSGGSASFSFSPTITAELASHTFQIYLKQGANLRLVREISDVTAGDVFLWYGQSNAQSSVYDGSSNAYASPWIRTFGMSSDSATVTQAYPFWVEANGDGSREVAAGVGQWPLVVGRKIVNDHGIPVAILNGARGGSSMPQLQRDDANPDNLTDAPPLFRTYNRLRYRANLAKVAAGVRGIFFYQGENDFNNTAQHMSGFASLMADWQVDYPAVEKIFVSQLHVGCGTSREAPELRDAQRLLPDLYEKVRIMSTNGLPGHDGCHYAFTGYETLGLNSYRQVARELYGVPDAPAIDAPNPARVEIADEAGTRLRIVLRKPNAGITVDTASLVDFRLTGLFAVLQSASVTATGIELQYDRRLDGATRLDYLGHSGSTGGWVRNGNGVGLLTFMEPIPNEFPRITSVSPATAVVAPGTILPLSATATTQAGTITRMEIFINGILYTAVGPGNTITDIWTMPASGNHRLVFRATNSGGRSSEASVVVFTQPFATPGGVDAGLTVWLKPEFGIDRDPADVVSSWQDSSGNNNHCTQATASAKPTYRTNQFGTMPGIHFDGGDWLGSSAGISTGSYTKIVRVSLDNSAQLGNILSSGSDPGAGHALFMNNQTTPRLWHGGISFAVSNTPMVAYREHILVATYDATNLTGILYLDGVQVGTGTAANHVNASYQLGAIAGGSFLRGTIGEVLVYDRVITGAERLAVENYLLTKSVNPPATPLLDYSSWSALNIPLGEDASVTGDFNGNGIQNGMEFALGSPPAAASVPYPLSLQTDSANVVVGFSRPTDRTGVSYQLMESFNLETWAPVDDLPGPVSKGKEQRSFTRPRGDSLKSFYRLEAAFP